MLTALLSSYLKGKIKVILLQGAEFLSLEGHSVKQSTVLRRCHSPPRLLFL